jgi:FkbM family methyltransferase
MRGHMKSNLEKILSNIQPYNLDEYTVVVFGAGNTSLLYQKCFEREGIHPAYYIDNSEAKQGTVFQGVPVISVEKLVSLQQTFSKPFLVIICTANIAVCNQIQSQLEKCELTYTTVDAFVFKKNAEKIKAVCDSLEDDFSKDVYIRMIQSRINNIPVSESLVSNDQYFLLPRFLERSEKEVFVDLGAYVGDSIEQYINKKSGVFKKIYAFEPDELNFSGLKHRATRLKNEWVFSDNKLTLVDGGVGSKTERIYLPPPPPVSNAENSLGSAKLGANLINNDKIDGTEVMIYAMDDYFKEQKVSFIKADIESYELDMLCGAEAVIKRDRPLLAVCIYHNASDMFTIPLFIKELYSDYKLKIRQHSYNYDETVLYAYVS